MVTPIVTQVAMVESIRKGTGVIHHLEPSYYQGIQNALDEVQGAGKALPRPAQEGEAA